MRFGEPARIPISPHGTSVARMKGTAVEGFWDRHRLSGRVRMWSILVAFAFLISGFITLANDASGGKYLLIAGAVIWAVEFIIDKIPGGAEDNSDPQEDVDTAN